MIKRVTIFLLTLFVISSCVSPKVYKELEDKYASLKKENRNLQTEFEDLKNAHNILNNEYDDLTQSYEAAKSEAAQLTSELEALEFLNNMVKPEYNQWEGKEDYEQRFLSFIEGKYADFI